MLWVDEKAPPNKWGHPADFFSILSTIEKKEFSKVICDRMFFDWQSEKLYQFMVMYDDVRNLKPRFVARTKPPAETPSGPATLSPPVTTPPPAPGTAAVTPKSPEADPNVVLTLSKLFDISGYNPYDDTFTNAIEKSPIDLSL
jgi:hypothetical protein